MTSPEVVRSVVKYLGRAVLLLAAMVFLLLWKIIEQGRGTGTVDAASVGAVGVLGGALTTTIGLLGGMLISTRSADEAPIEAKIVNDVDERVPVEES